MNSNISSPSKSFPFNHSQKLSHQSESMLDPVIHYNPESSRKVTTEVKTRRTKIFENRSSKVASIRKQPEQLVSQNALEQKNLKTVEIIQKLSLIQQKVQQIEEVVSNCVSKQKSQCQRMNHIILQQQKQLAVNQISVHQTDQKIAQMIKQKNILLKNVSNLNEVIGQQNKKQFENKIQEKNRVTILKQQLEIQLLNFQKERSQKEYHRIKNSAARKQDYKKEIQKIKRKVISQRRYTDKYSSQISDNSNIQYRKQLLEIPFVKPIQEHIQNQIITPVEQGNGVVEEISIKDRAQKLQGKLYITQSQIYPFLEQEKIQLL